MNRLLASWVVLCCFACASPQQHEANEAVETPTSEVSVTEDDLITRLSVDLIAEPKTQLEREKNIIINYAIDNLMDVQATNTGLYYEILEAGEGEHIEWGDYIRAHYKGYFMDGKVFDSTYKRERPMKFYVGNMIDGWNEGLEKIAPKGKIRLLVPSALAYAEKGLATAKGDTLVPAHSTLIFDIEVLEKVK